jgi:outer membrane protein assembly factor BamB
MRRNYTLKNTRAHAVLWICAIVSLLAALAAEPAIGLSSPATENWPHWRGPNLNGTSAETGLPTTWDTETNVAWKLDIAESWTGATPIIWEDSIFLNVSYVQRAAERGGRRGRGGNEASDVQFPTGDEMQPNPDLPDDTAALIESEAFRAGGAVRRGQDETLNVELWRVDRRNGTVIWKRFLSDNDHQERKQNMSSPSPVTDGEHIWTMTGTGWLRAFDFDGNEIWARNISNDYWSFGLNWGFASSPLLHEDALYVQVLHGMKTDEPSYLLRIDKITGETVWMVQRPTDAIHESPDSYTTPALLQYDGKMEIVITGGDVVTGHDPATGEELWRADGLNPRNNRNYRIVASPLVVGDIVIAPTRVRPMLALKAGGRGDVTESNLLWSFDSGPDVPTPVSDGELLYVVTDNGVMHALDVHTGEIVYTNQRLEPGTYSSSPTLADGKIYALSEDGITTVVKAGREFEILARNSLDGYTLSTPSVSQGHIYIRSGATLYAIAEGVDS